MELFDLTGHVALVTGGSRGLGLAMAGVLGRAGAKLAITARKEGELAAAAQRLREAGCEVLAVPNDLARPELVPAMVERVLGHYGQVDVLVNNAGSAWAAAAEDYPLGAWQKLVELNLTGTWAVTQAVAKQSMIPRRRGSIVFVSSICGLQGNRRDMLQTAAYNATKAGQINLARALAGEWGGYDIRVNAIAPGFIPSKMSDDVIDAMGKRYLDRVPLGRCGEEDDLAGPLLLLASDAGRYVTGHTLVVDGGLTAVW